MARNIRLHSPHAPVPLAKILKEEMSRKWTKAEKKSWRVMGGGTEETFFLKVARKNFYSDFSTRFTGTLSEDGSGTLIDGKMGRSPATGCVMLFWFGFMGFFIFMGLIVAGSDDAPFLFKLAFLGVPILLMLGGLAVLKFAPRYGRRDEKRILEFLRDRVDAKEEGVL